MKLPTTFKALLLPFFLFAPTSSSAVLHPSGSSACQQASWQDLTTLSLFAQLAYYICSLMKITTLRHIRFLLLPLLLAPVHGSNTADEMAKARIEAITNVLVGHQTIIEGSEASAVDLQKTSAAPSSLMLNLQILKQWLGEAKDASLLESVDTYFSSFLYIQYNNRKNKKALPLELKTLDQENRLMQLLQREVENSFYKDTIGALALYRETKSNLQDPELDKAVALASLTSLSQRVGSLTSPLYSLESRGVWAPVSRLAVETYHQHLMMKIWHGLSSNPSWSKLPVLKKIAELDKGCSIMEVLARQLVLQQIIEQRLAKKRAIGHYSRRVDHNIPLIISDRISEYIGRYTAKNVALPLLEPLANGDLLAPVIKEILTRGEGVQRYLPKAWKQDFSVPLCVSKLIGEYTYY